MRQIERITKHPLTKKWERAVWYEGLFPRETWGARFSDGAYFSQGEFADELIYRHCDSCKCEEDTL